MAVRPRLSSDALTGLPNRTLLADRLQQYIGIADRYASKVAVAFVDLDQFKLINDSMGHDAGDALLKIMASRLANCMRESDTVVRLGGDEFVLLLAGLHKIEDIGRWVLRTACRHALAEIRRIFFTPLRRIN